MANQKSSTKEERPVIICTEHRGVFFGFVPADYSIEKSGPIVKMRAARMAIYWGTTRGVIQLAETGPTGSSKISAAADIEVNKITAVFEVKEPALKVWEAVK
jgi:hypothetical protein